MFAIVDTQDHERLSNRKWHAVKRTKPNGTDYAAGWPNPRGSAKHQDRLHRVIMDAKPGEDVRFRDGNGLNCSRANLQIVTTAELRRTSKRSETHNTSGAKGVSFNNGKNIQRRWRAYICVNRKHIGLGHHATFEEAVAARRAGEQKYHGEFANDQLAECNPALPAVLNVTWFPPAEIHRLSEIDEELQLATCSICGPVKVKWGGKSWACFTKVKACRFRNRKKHNRQQYAHKRPQILLKKDHCERCAFVAVHSCQLDVHHRDYDCKNNDPSNLETLCSNCHRLETQMKRDEIFKETQSSVWVGSKKRKANLHHAAA